MFFFKRRRNVLSDKIYRLNRGPRFANPRRQLAKNFVASIFSYINILLILAIGYFAYFFVLSGYFNIDNVEVAGNEKISSFDVLKVANNYIDGRRYYILPNSNLIFLSKTGLSKRINENFIFNSLLIDKISPNTVKIIINEKVPVMQFTNAERTYLVDGEGVLIQRLFGKEALTDIYKLNDQTQTEIDYTKFSYDELPLIINQTQDSLDLGQKILSKEKIDYTLELIKQITKIAYFKINRVEIPDKQAQYLYVTNDPGNWQVIFNYNDDIGRQLSRLDLLIKETIKEDKLSRVEYIDLRMGENIYYKMK